MNEILKKLHVYVPIISDGCTDGAQSSHPQKIQQLAFGGDQLTAARARKGIQVRINSRDPSTALRGLAPFAADWHAKVNFVSVSM